MLRLTVDAEAWVGHVERTARRLSPGLVPVVKGNGYGFGRATLAPVAARLSSTMAVGTVHELDHVPAGTTAVVLTPTRHAPAEPAPVLTVGSLDHVAVLAGWRGRVIVKLASSMRRFGTTPDDLGRLAAAARGAGLEIVGFAVHPPLAGADDEHLADIGSWLGVLDPDDEVWVSHLSPTAYRDLRQTWPDRRFRIRAGTALWHGDAREKGVMLHLGADVLDTRAVRAGDRAGYRQERVPVDGTIVMIGAGTAHGVQPLDDGRSPFHFARRRLALVEPPHMHVAMAVVPAGDPTPAPGDVVDVQRPLITTLVDEVRWRRPDGSTGERTGSPG